MLNGYHLCLSYFGLANNLKYVHELLLIKTLKILQKRWERIFRKRTLTQK